MFPESCGVICSSHSPAFQLLHEVASSESMSEFLSGLPASPEEPRGQWRPGSHLSEEEEVTMEGEGVLYRNGCQK